MNIKAKIYLFILSSFSVVFFSCKKDNIITTPVQSEFVNSSTLGKYFIKNDPNSVFKIPVGITTVSKSPRTLTFSVSSPTGAVQGQQYNLPSTSVVIPAGTAVDSISLNGIFDGYASGRQDTLIFTITGGDVSVFSAQSTYKVVLQQYCEVNLSDFMGDFANSYDTQEPDEYGPYTATINTITSTGPTSATIYIQNFAGAGLGPWESGAPPLDPGIAVKLDWSDPANFTTIVPTQLIDENLYGYGAGTISAVGSGTFSSCNNTITINYTVTVDAGSFGDFVTYLQR